MSSYCHYPPQITLVRYNTSFASVKAVMLLWIKGVIAASLDIQCHSFKIGTWIVKVVVLSQYVTLLMAKLVCCMQAEFVEVFCRNSWLYTFKAWSKSCWDLPFDIGRHAILSGKACAASSTQRGFLLLAKNLAASLSPSRQCSYGAVSQVLCSSFCCSTWQSITRDLVSFFFFFEVDTDCKAWMY